MLVVEFYYMLYQWKELNTQDLSLFRRVQPVFIGAVLMQIEIKIKKKNANTLFYHLLYADKISIIFKLSKAFVLNYEPFR